MKNVLYCCFLLLPVALAGMDQLVATGRNIILYIGDQVSFTLQRTTDKKKQVDPQPLLVINAGNGRTGTGSFVKAMERLGIKCYHMKEGVLETDGHMGFWGKFLIDQSITYGDVLDAISNDGFNASADAPMNFFYKEQMERYPNAPVILSIRSEDENAAVEWQKSLFESIFRFPPIMSQIPFRWMPGLSRFREFTTILHNLMAGNPEGRSEDIDPAALVKFYHEWIEDVRRNVPEHKLLVFKAKDGWEPLCRHISHVSPIVADNCKEVLLSGEPYPRVNDRSSIQRTQFVMRCVIAVTYIILCTLPLVGWFCLRLMLRRNRKPKSD